MNWIKKLFGNKDNSKEVFFHEDLYCQVEIVPAENAAELDSENENIQDFAEKHREGLGFTDIYQRSEHQYPTSDRAIPLTDFHELLTNCGYNLVTKVFTGYGQTKELCKNTCAYELGGSLVYCDLKEEIVKNIWLDNFRFNTDSPCKDQMRNCLQEIGRNWNLTLNDWDLSENIDLRDNSSVEKYISEK